MEKELKELLEKSIKLAEKTGEFAIEQAPMLLREFYTWEIVSSCLGILLGLFFISLGLIIFKLSGSKKIIIEYGEDAPYIFGRYYDIGSKMIAFMSLIILGFVGLVVFFDNLYHLIFVLVSPKLYLIEYFIK